MTNLHKMALVRRFLRSRKGNIAIISALMMPAIVGFCGLAGETAYWYYRHRDIQGAADLAAFGGAAVLRSGSNSLTAITAASKADAVTNGWRQANGTIAVNWPPTSGSWQNQQSVQVILTENQTRIFSRLFNGSAAVPISVRSTATVLAAGKACILGLNNTLPGTVTFWGNSTTTLTNCNVMTNSSSPTGFMQGGSSTAWMPCAYSAGGEQSTAGLHLTSCGSVVQHHPRSVDPYKDVPAPTWSGCGSAPNTTAASNVTITNPDGVRCFNANTSFQGTVHFDPGVYVIDGASNADLLFGANSNISGSGVMFYLTNGANLDMVGTPHLALSAATSGTYSGLLFFGDRTQANATNKMLGDVASAVTGAIYFPSQRVEYLGNFTGSGGCTQVIADTIYYTGSGTFNSDCTAYGQQAAIVYGSISLVE